MARRAPPDATSALPDLTSMMDLTFNIMSFFVMLTTLAKDEAAQRITLPISQSAALIDDERVPDSFGVNVGYLEPAPGAGRRATMLLAGLELDLTREDHWKQFERIIKADADVQKTAFKAKKKDWKKEGLTTTIIIRVDQEVEAKVFLRIIDLCRTQGYRKFQYKAAGEEAPRAP